MNPASALDTNDDGTIGCGLCCALVMMTPVFVVTIIPATLIWIVSFGGSSDVKLLLSLEFLYDLYVFVGM